jgi:ABC-2 type transport system permease protein
VEPLDEATDERSGFAFIAVILLYGQIIGFGYFVAMGGVEEKSSRVVEVLLVAIRPTHKLIGLGILGLEQLLLLAVLGLGGRARRRRRRQHSRRARAGLFLVGYAFHASPFACAGALVPRQEELQSVLTPLTLLLLVSFFAVLDDPCGTLATLSRSSPSRRR